MHGAQVDVDIGVLGVREGGEEWYEESRGIFRMMVSNAGQSPLRVALSRPFPFFLWSSRPKKEPKKGRMESFAPAGATRASRPRPAQAFEKA